MSVESAYRHCEAITHAAAANFFYGIRLLPASKKRAMCAAYAFARRVDDIGDGDLPTPEKVALLAEERARLDGSNGDDPVLVALRDSDARFSLPWDALHSLIDGVEADVHGTTYDSFEELVVYCRQVAGSIGRLSLAIFGTADWERASGLADDLGVAMQLTNILRDVREDAERGRVYLPREDLERFDCPEGPLTGSPEAARDLIRFQAMRDREWFARGMQLLPMLDSRSAACVGAMTGIYRRILDRIERAPEEVMHRRIALPPWEKAWVATWSLANGAAGGQWAAAVAGAHRGNGGNGGNGAATATRSEDHAA